MSRCVPFSRSRSAAPDSQPFLRCKNGVERWIQKNDGNVLQKWMIYIYHYIIENMENIIVINDASVMEMFIFIWFLHYIYILCVCDILIHMHVFGDVTHLDPQAINSLLFHGEPSLKLADLETLPGWSEGCTGIGSLRFVNFQRVKWDPILFYLEWCSCWLSFFGGCFNQQLLTDMTDISAIQCKAWLDY